MCCCSHLCYSTLVYAFNIFFQSATVIMFYHLARDNRLKIFKHMFIGIYIISKSIYPIFGTRCCPLSNLTYFIILILLRCYYPINNWVMSSRRFIKPHCSWKGIPGKVSQYNVSIFSQVTDNWLILIQQKTGINLNKGMCQMRGSISGPLAY